ncbi:MAG: AAA family ATPase [Gemmatimonadota bacterium]|nr:AAA family ATPase [Gemmatimonadota bacterium]
MSALENITIKGFKSIGSIENLKLGPINVLIGPNGSGKSNFIEVFSFLREIILDRLKDYVDRAGGADKILHFGSRTTEELLIDISFDDIANRYTIRLRATDTDMLYLSSESDRFWNAHSDSDIRNHPDRWRVYHFHDTSSTSPMRKTADVNDNRYLRSDASNLAAFLYYLHEKHAVAYNLIRRTVQQVTPFFDDFLLQPLALNNDKIRLEWRHKKSEAYFDASSLSDGSLRFIALATLFLQPESLRPSIILLDEPELGLHPYAIAMLASLVKQASIKTQVILSTQSSLLIDHFQPEDVLVAERVDGQTQFTRLNATRLETWLEDYSLGQLWEKNEIGGRPVVE